MSAGSRANQYIMVSNDACPPVIIKSVVFMAISMPIMEMNDMEKAVFSARTQSNFSLVLNITVSKAMDVQRPAMTARIICQIMDVPG